MSLRRLPFHPLLFAVLPILSLFAQNQHLLVPSDLFEPIAFALAGCAVLWLVLAAFTRDRFRAAAAASWILLVFYFFPSLHAALVVLWPVSLATCLAVWVAASLAGALALLRSRGDLSSINRVLNAVAAVALAIPIGTSVSNALSHADAGLAGRETPSAHAAETSRAGTAPAATPDIYYIILDAYGRDDVLRRYYDHDNGAFLRGLEERGFYVARRSRSNYAQTYLSLASSLNSTYLDDLAERVGADSEDRGPLRRMIMHSRAAAFLRDHGYTFVSFSSGYTGTEIPGADHYLTPRGAVTELEQMLLEATPLPAIFRALGRPDLRYQAHRSRVLFTLSSLGRRVESEGPAFVFAHVFSPHPPFVFGPDGEAPQRSAAFSIRDGGRFTAGGKPEYVRRYRDQLRFLNGRVLEAIDAILRGARRPPIIVLQSDHGPGSCWEETDAAKTDHHERMPILNAFYFPDRRYERLYQDITPVNTFRVIFTQYFGADEPLLPDRSYGSSWTRPYRFLDVTGQVSGG